MPLIFPTCPLWKSLLQEFLQSQLQQDWQDVRLSTKLFSSVPCQYVFMENIHLITDRVWWYTSHDFFFRLWVFLNFGIQSILRNLWSTCLACNLSKIQLAIRKELFLYCSVILLLPLCWGPTALPASNSITYLTLNKNKKQHSTLKIKLFCCQNINNFKGL